MTELGLEHQVGDDPCVAEKYLTRDDAEKAFGAFLDQLQAHGRQINDMKRVIGVLQSAVVILVGIIAFFGISLLVVLG